MGSGRRNGHHQLHNLWRIIISQQLSPLGVIRKNPAWMTWFASSSTWGVWDADFISLLLQLVPQSYSFKHAWLYRPHDQHRFIIHIWWSVSGPEQEDKPGQRNLTCLLITSFLRCRKHMRKQIIKFLIDFLGVPSSRATNSQVKLINWYGLICIFFPHVKYWGRGILSVSWN